MKKMTHSLPKKRLNLAEEVMSNEDLLLEVLLRLPAKALIRLKSVSKHWLSLISDPKFCSKHSRLNSKSQASGIYFKFDFAFASELKSVSFNQAKQNDVPRLSFARNALPSYHPDQIMHSCNGLFLYSYNCKSPFSVCNLATGAVTTLPQHPCPVSGSWYRGEHFAYLVFDPLRSPHFKVVLLYLSPIRPETVLHNDHQKHIEESAYSGWCYEIDIFCSEKGVWKRMYFRAPHGFLLDYKAVCNGSLHWITTNKFHARFEVDTENVMFNPLPQKPKSLDVEKIRYFGECCGHLFLVNVPWRSGKVFNVLELDKDNSNWTMKYCIQMSPLRTAFPSSSQWPDPYTRGNIPAKRWNFFVLCVMKEDEINGGFALLLALPGKIVSYNLKRNTIKVLKETPLIDFPLADWYVCAHSFPFVPILSPI